MVLNPAPALRVHHEAVSSKTMKTIQKKGTAKLKGKKLTSEANDRESILSLAKQFTDKSTLNRIKYLTNGMLGRVECCAI